ncbi:MAG: YicC/YloC family endoribonuclease [Desulforegulaceae bacterium]|nr:YicC/YloC family endoribonuclease [Desulforegulaceae bacterium]
MILSMTSYSRAEKTKEDLKISVEARTYNSRFLDIALKVSSDFADLEEIIKKKISSVISRGRVEIKCYFEDLGENDALISIDSDKAKAYFNIYEKLRNELGIKEEIKIEQILKSDGVIKKNEKKDNTKYLGLLNEVMDEMLSALIKARKLEGEVIYNDFCERLSLIDSLIKEIEAESENAAKEYFNKLQLKIKDLVSSAELEIDESRFAQEAAFLADKTDVSEEILRFKTHLIQFKKYMDSDSSPGRNLNFLLQELHREINTLGVKQGSVKISKNCVEIKSELEKLREQVQNIE